MSPLTLLQPSILFSYKIKYKMRPAFVMFMAVVAIALMPNIAQATAVDKKEEVNTEVKVPEIVPEEVLRSEILIDGRSSLDGRRLSAAEYVELQDQLELANTVEPQIAFKLRRTVGLIKLRKFIKTVLPFVPIK